MCVRLCKCAFVRVCVSAELWHSITLLNEDGLLRNFVIPEDDIYNLLIRVISQYQRHETRSKKCSLWKYLSGACRPFWCERTVYFLASDVKKHIFAIACVPNDARCEDLCKFHITQQADEGVSRLGILWLLVNICSSYIKTCIVFICVRGRLPLFMSVSHVVTLSVCKKKKVYMCPWPLTIIYVRVPCCNS